MGRYVRRAGSARSDGGKAAGALLALAKKNWWFQRSPRAERDYTSKRYCTSAFGLPLGSQRMRSSRRPPCSAAVPFCLGGLVTLSGARRTARLEHRQSSQPFRCCPARRRSSFAGGWWAGAASGSLEIITDSPERLGGWPEPTPPTVQSAHQSSRASDPVASPAAPLIDHG